MTPSTPHRKHLKKVLALLVLIPAVCAGLLQLAPGTAQAVTRADDTCGGDIKQWLVYDSFYKGLAAAALTRIGCGAPFTAIAIGANRNITGFNVIEPPKGWTSCGYHDTQTIGCQRSSTAVKHANAWIETDPFQGCPTGLRVGFEVKFADQTISNAYSFGKCTGRFPTGQGRQPKTQIKVTPTGRIGKLQLGRSTQADVVRQYGKPRARVHPQGAVKPAVALEYDMQNATPTMFIFNSRTHRLSDLYTSSPKFRTPEGTSPGTFALTAQRNEKQGAQPIKTPDNCSDHGIILAAQGGRRAALAYRTTFVALMYSVDYINLSSALGTSYVYDNRMFVSGPHSVFVGPTSSGGGHTSVRPVCHLSRRASRSKRR
ncbi:MAG: hypothetical protein ACJ764_03995 [Solirubrobacteraceae bacterium]